MPRDSGIDLRPAAASRVANHQRIRRRLPRADVEVIAEDQHHGARRHEARRVLVVERSRRQARPDAAGAACEAGGPQAGFARLPRSRRH